MECVLTVFDGKRRLIESRAFDDWDSMSEYASNTYLVRAKRDSWRGGQLELWENGQLQQVASN